MKIAVVSTGSTNNRKGAFNNVHERIKHLQSVNGVEVDSFLIRQHNDWVFKALSNKNNELIEEISTVDGVDYNNLWVKHRISDYLLTYKLKLKDIQCKSQLEQFVPLFKGYDLLSVHSPTDIYLAYMVKQKYKIPYVSTWHGSDINVLPFSNKNMFKTTKELIRNADYNFFVSKRLKQTSDKIIKTDNKDHLYTGPSDIFKPRNLEEKNRERIELNIHSKHLIGFIGNFVQIKNVLILPEIFNAVNNRLENVSFIVVGNGKLGDKLKNKMIKMNVHNVIFTGKMEPEEIPNLMKSLDILVLPSLNEGMPRVALEALVTGVHIVGSDVGGIPESIGVENSFALDDDFVDNISDRIIEIISTGEKPKPLSEEFSWEKAIEKEMRVYKAILNTGE